MSEPQKHFFEIKDPIVVARLLDIAVRHGLAVTVWTKDQAFKFEATMSYYFRKLKRVSFTFPPEVNEKIFRKELIKQGNDYVFISFELQTTPFFFKSEFIAGTPGNKFEVQTPKSIFKFQRRTALRITFVRRDAPKLTVVDPKIEIQANELIDDSNLLPYRVVDVSAGGIGLVAPLSHADRLTVGLRLKDIRFRLKGIEVIVDGEIRFVAPTVTDLNEKALRVGIQFKALKPEDEAHIARVVLDKSRHLFSLIS